MSIQEGDPGKLAYFKDPNWHGKPRVQGFAVDPRACPGCMFGVERNSRKWPHTFDVRCKLGEVIEDATLLLNDPAFSDSD